MHDEDAIDDHVPTPQLPQVPTDVAAMTLEYRPATHDVHDDEARLDHVPTPQLVQVAAEVALPRLEN